MVRLEPAQQVRRRVPTLTERADDALAIAPDVYNEYGPWSALKLIVLVATVNMYTTVISDYYDDWFYIDALAGSGVSIADNGNEDVFLGSPILAAMHAHEPFTKMYFIEKHQGKASALEDRLEWAFDEFDISQPEYEYEVICGDANQELNGVVQDMWGLARRDGKPRFHNLLFVDNQGFDVCWDGMKSVGDNTSGDFLINFPTPGLNRNTYQEESHDALTKYFGGDMWREADSAEELIEIYCRRLSGFDNEIQVTTNVDSGVKNYQYDVIYATRKTQSGSDYVNAVKYVKEFVEEVDGGDVNQMLDILYGDQEVLQEFMSQLKDPRDQLRDENQSGLSDFP